VTPTPGPSVRQCPKCKQELPDNVRFCPNDGTPLVETAATRPDSSTPTGGLRPPSREIPLPVVLGNRYRLEELRGGGGMAKVYRAVDQTLEREVAVKVINPELRNEPEFDTRFSREARIASQLADPNIVVVHDFGLDPVLGPYLVMEYLQGQSVRERLAREGPLPVKAAVEVAGKLFLALMHAHDKGIVHRDIKPDNIFLLNQSGVKLSVRVLDFGIARIYRRDESSKAETITHAGAVLGTPRYMSPEQLAGNPVDARTDLYSAALVIFESLTGQLPYAGAKRLCELVPDAPASLQEVLEHCLRPDPAERPDSALEVYIRLQEAGKASGILMMPPGGIEKLIAARRKSQTVEPGEPTLDYRETAATAGRTRRRYLIAVGAVLLLLAATALVWWLFFRPDPTFPAGPEAIHGVAIGDSESAVEEKVLLPRSESGKSPWEVPRLQRSLGKLLRPQDLGLPEGEVSKVRARFSEDSQFVVLLHDGKVVAVVSSRRGDKARRGVGVGSSTSEVERLYVKERPVPGTAEQDGKHIDLRRYPALGVGFESYEGRVTAVILYPPAK
jgi:tRNA A-37 threonylcarbamoyl transferase component Bud32